MKTKFDDAILFPIYEYKNDYNPFITLDNIRVVPGQLESYLSINLPIHFHVKMFTEVGVYVTLVNATIANMNFR